MLCITKCLRTFLSNRIKITIKKNPESDQEKRYRSGSLLRGIAFSIIEIKNSENL